VTYGSGLGGGPSSTFSETAGQCKWKKQNWGAEAPRQCRTPWGGPLSYAGREAAPFWGHIRSVTY
jgi:hypothetical protein